MTDFFEYYTFISYLIIGSAYCFGIFKIFDDVLVGVRAKLEYLIGPKWCRPLVSCPPCLASVHGFYLGLIFFGLNWTIPLYCICLCGLNYIVNSLLPEYD
jgi:hypothetical protein